MPYLKMRFADEADPAASAKRKKELLRYLSKAEEFYDINDLVASARTSRNEMVLTREDYNEIIEAAASKKEELRNLYNSSLAKKTRMLAEFLRSKYQGEAAAEKPNQDFGEVQAYVPMELKREEFESVLADWCKTNGCEYELRNQTPTAKTPQYYPENFKLMNVKAGETKPETIKDIEEFEKLVSKDQNKMKKLFKEEYGHDFNRDDKEDCESMVWLYNEVSYQLFCKSNREEMYKNLSKEGREKDFDLAKKLFKRMSGKEFDPNDPDDREDIVLIYNEYMDELSEWRPVLIRIKLKEEE